MKRGSGRLRFGEVWVDCAACRSAYVEVKNDKGRYAKLLDGLGGGQLSRIRGASKPPKQFARILRTNVEIFAGACGVAIETLLKGGTGQALDEEQIDDVGEVARKFVYPDSLKSR